jgi:hypothetical protein
MELSGQRSVLVLLSGHGFMNYAPQGTSCSMIAVWKPGPSAVCTATDDIIPFLQSNEKQEGL